MDKGQNKKTPSTGDISSERPTIDWILCIQETDTSMDFLRKTQTWLSYDNVCLNNTKLFSG